MLNHCHTHIFDQGMTMLKYVTNMSLFQAVESGKSLSQMSLIQAVDIDKSKS